MQSTTQCSQAMTPRCNTRTLHCTNWNILSPQPEKSWSQTDRFPSQTDPTHLKNFTNKVCHDTWTMFSASEAVSPVNIQWILNNVADRQTNKQTEWDINTTSVHLCSVSRGLLIMAHHRLSSYGRQALSVAGPAIWNWLSDSLRDPAISRDSFKRSLKAFLFSAYSCT